MIGRLLFAILMVVILSVVLFFRYAYALLALIFWDPTVLGEYYDEDRPLYKQYAPVWTCLTEGVKAVL